MRDGRVAIPASPFAAIFMLVAACEGAGVKRIEVGRHVFHVPEANLEGAQMPFLPASQEQSLMALLNPGAPPKEQRMILVQPVSAVCKPGVQLGDRQRRVCAMARGEAPPSGSIGRLTKVLRHPDDPTQYDYRDDGGAVVLMCNANEGGGGSCDLMQAWHDLIWSIDFPESELAKVEDLHTEVARRLDEWSAPHG